ncbi:ATP-binding protein [Rhabdobacter roseus]|uniref:Putative HTH transcriptional regulator n=1 Tax=Rhabdobacter roseus TaxID=1655419 RepID=A0A840TV31_9BACT|nr:ATP-binding protein [Rhabdobacter roseus]MBB5283529.1 putative HTH transcriptional regulator [Rhabdobacter roseus]
MTSSLTNTLDLILKGEGLTVEFKRTIDSPYKIARTLSSFANTSGGVLLVGVADNRDVIGVLSELREMQKIEKASSFLVEKPLLIRYQAILLGSKKILHIEVDESEDKPHYALNEKGERIIYVRTKDKTIPTNRLMLAGERDAETEKLLALKPVKILIQYLKQHDMITAKVLSHMINISEKRATRLLNDLSDKQVLLKIERGKPIAYSLKLVQ